MILYGSIMSPFVRKTMAYASEKSLELTLRGGGMGHGGAEFEETSPFRKMPGFRDPGALDGEDFVISDSTAIITYLEAKYPEPNLIPTSPAARARTIWYEEFADTIVMACCGKMFFNRFVAPKVLKMPGDAAAADNAETKELPPLLDYLEGVVPDSGFLVEDRLTLADLSIASPFINLAHVDVGICPERWPRTAAYVSSIVARPSFAQFAERERAMVAALG